MADPYPELVPMQARIEDTVRHEEERFAETLETGLARINEYVETHGGTTLRRRSVPKLRPP